jgi:hypothetical protein
MIPYPEPFQSIFQKRRLGTLGFEWRPPSVDFAVGPTYNATTGEFQTIPIIDPDRWEPLPEITDFVELEPENEVVSDDTDSEYNGMDEYSSGEQEILSGDSSGASYSSAEIDMDNPSSAVHKRKPRRKKKKSEVSDKHLIFFMLSSVFLLIFLLLHTLQADLVTSSGRLVKKRNLDVHDVATVSRPHRVRKSRNGRSSKRKRSPKSRGLRPQRRAARNARGFWSKMGASTEEDEDYSEGSFSDREINTDSTDPEEFEQNGQLKIGREINNHHYESEDVTQSSRFSETKGNSGTNRKLVLRIPRRDLKVEFHSESGKAECSIQDKAVMSNVPAYHESVEPELTTEPGLSSACKLEIMTDGTGAVTSGLNDVSAIHSNNSMKWGEVKMRSSKRCKYSDSAGSMRSTSNNAFSQDVEMPYGYGEGIQQRVEQNVQEIQPAVILDKIQENHSTDECNGDSLLGKEKIASNNNTCTDGENNTEPISNTSQPKSLKLKFKSRGFADGANLSAKSSDISSEQQDEDSAIDQHKNSDFINMSRNIQECTDNQSTGVHDSKKIDSAKVYTVVYTRSKSNNKKKMDSDECTNEDSTSISNDDDGYQPPEQSPVAAASGRLRRSSRRSFAYSGDGRGDDISQVKGSYGSHGASTSGRRTVTDVREVMWRPTSKTVGLRSARNKRDNFDLTDTHLLGKRNQGSSKHSWLMLREHEDSYRYIPQLGDEVLYLRQVILFASIIFVQNVWVQHRLLTTKGFFWHFMLYTYMYDKLVTSCWCACKVHELREYGNAP